MPVIKVTANFSEQMDPTTINSTTFKLFEKVGTTNQRVAAVASYSAGYKRAVLKPNANRTPGAKFTAQLTTGVQDLASNSLARRKDITFTIRTQ